MTPKILGYNGKILRVNLSENSIRDEAIDEKICRRYIGGAGFVAYYLNKELKQGIDALGPDNKLIFALGPLTGLQFPGSARNCVGAKSPLTGGMAKSEAGGNWSVELKRAGYDAIIVEGKAERPVYLWVHDGEASIRDATHIWGKNTKETQEDIRAELGDSRIQAALIGPAGENMVRYACIMNGLFDAAGRGGLGAVAGSKNLKAIAVRGHKAPPTADRERIKEMRKQILVGMVPHVYGTGGAEMEMFEATGNLPVRNFRDGLFPEVKQIHGVVIKETIGVGMEGCYACPRRCKKVVKVEEPYPVDPAYGGPEYETLAALGSNCGVGNVKAIAKANELCGAYSLDTISTGSNIAFAMECFEKGLLSLKDTDGIELKFGNDEAMLKVIELIARRQGIGDVLAEGTARLSAKLGSEANDFAMHVKGLEPGMHEPRLSAGLGLGFAVAPHGADHVCNVLDFMFLSEHMIKNFNPLGVVEAISPDDMSPRKAAILRTMQFRAILQDSLVMCGFISLSMEKQAELLAATTGWNTGVGELLRAAERTLTTARLFNMRQGLTADDDKLPERFFTPKTDGALSDKALDHADFEKAKSYYYDLMGWDTKTGVPKQEKLEELQIIE